MLSQSFLSRAVLAALLGLACLLQPAESARAQAAESLRRCILFDRGWEFHLGDNPGADDSGWQHVNLPHDWMIAGVKGPKQADMDGPFDKGSPAGAGGAYLNGGVGCRAFGWKIEEADK